MNEEEIKAAIETAIKSNQEQNDIKFKALEDEVAKKDNTIKEYKELINTSLTQKQEKEEEIEEYGSSFLKEKEKSIKEAKEYE